MNVWLIQIGEALPIKPGTRMLRTAYVADELLKRGHEVVWWASAFDHFKKKWLFNEESEVILSEKYIIKMLKGIGYNKNISMARLIDHRILAKKFWEMAFASKRPDIIVSSMPAYDLSYKAVKFATLKNIPILIDVRDQWPDIFLDKVPFAPRSLKKIMLYQEYKMLKETLKGATGIMSMMDSLHRWALAYAERERTWKDKVFYLGYKPTSEHSLKGNKIRALTKEIKNKFVVTFIGTFAEYHNPTSLIDSADILKNNSKIHFVLAGDGPLMPKIRKRASNLANVSLTGWIDQREITFLLRHSHVGVCTTNRKAHFFPNKAFSYFSEGLPVISAFQGDLKDIIERYGLGYYYEPMDVMQLSNLILKICNNKTIYKKMSTNATAAFSEMFDANKIYDEYVSHLEQVYDKYKNVQ